MLPRCLSLLPEASWARHVPSQVREALNKRFVTLLDTSHVYLARAEREEAGLATDAHLFKEAFK